VVTAAATDVRIDTGAALTAGAFVEVRGYPRADGKVYAQQLRVRSAGGSNQPYLQGVVSAKSSPTFVIMGITVTTDASTEYHSEDHVAADAGATTQATFFNAITAGETIARVQWAAGASVTAPAKEAEIEDQDG
jgi:hypothetical protein